MSTDLSTEAITLVNPSSGEQFSLDAPLDTLASFLSAVKEYTALAREQANIVSQEVLNRFDKSARWTATAGDLKLSAPSPAPTEEWDGAELRTALLELVDRGVLDMGAVDAAVVTEVKYVPRKAGINQLRKIGGEVRDVVDGLARESEPKRYVRVTRSIP